MLLKKKESIFTHVKNIHVCMLWPPFPCGAFIITFIPDFCLMYRNDSDLALFSVQRDIKEGEAVLYYPSHLSEFGEHHYDGGVVLPQHSPEVLCGLG